MYKLLVTLMIIVSILIIICVMMQPSKQNNAASALTGGAAELFGKQKARGFEAVMKKTTAVLGVLWFALGIIISFMG